MINKFVFLKLENISRITINHIVYMTYSTLHPISVKGMTISETGYKSYILVDILEEKCSNALLFVACHTSI